MISHVQSKKTKQNENRLTDTENNRWLPRGRGVGEGWIGSLEIADANWYIQNG